MGNAQSIPVLSEVVTAAEIGARGAVGIVADVIGKDEVVKDMKDGIEKSVKGYVDKQLVISTVRAFAADSQQEKKEIRSTRNAALQGFAESTPVVGHVMAGFYALDGKEDDAKRALKGATRSAAVIVAGAATGGLAAGAIVPVAIGAGASATAGVVYDKTVSEITDEPYGTTALIEKAKNTGQAKDVVTTVLSIASDATVGAIAASPTLIQIPAGILSDVEIIVSFVNMIKEGDLIVQLCTTFLEALSALGLSACILPILSCGHFGLLALAALVLFQELDRFGDIVKLLAIGNEVTSALRKEVSDLQKSLSKVSTLRLGLHDAVDRLGEQARPVEQFIYTAMDCMVGMGILSRK